jgi:ABC-type nickel/cobalt efflux system permease component RcnA
MLAGERFDLRTAAAAVWAVGMRPCSGALIVLTFALLNGLILGGVLSVLAMAAGTAITVSALATLAVVAKNAAVRVAGGGRTGTLIHDGIEITGALLVLLLGLVLFAASLNA